MKSIVLICWTLDLFLCTTGASIYILTLLVSHKLLHKLLLRFYTTPQPCHLGAFCVSDVV
jgi:hypothetical protein